MKQNLNLLIYLNNISENWIVDRTKKEFLVFLRPFFKTSADFFSAF